MTIKEAFQQTVNQLQPLYEASESKSISRILFEDYFEVYDFTSEKEFSAKQISDLQELTLKLLRGTPVQYLVGKANFYGLFFKVTPAVLIPRSETEELVHLILETIPTRVLQRGIDIGTGSGCIPVTLKHKRPNWEIHATDISQSALKIAQQNANNLNSEVHFHEFDILSESCWPDLEKFDFIVSNPPYIPPSEKELMPSSVLEHEPTLALFTPEHDPLIFYRKIAAFAKRFLKNSGMLFFEVNEFNAKKVVGLLEREGFVDVLLEKDMQGKDRMIKSLYTVS